MKREVTLNNSQKQDINYNADKYNKDSILLVRLDKVPQNYTSEDFITSRECTKTKEYIIKDRKDVFKTIYDTGRELYKLYSESEYNGSLEYHYTSCLLNDETYRKQLIEIFNKFVYENGYPYLTKDLPYLRIQSFYLPSYFNFMDQCIDIYLMEEIRKWIIKIKILYEDTIKKKKNNISVSIPVRRLIYLFKSIKERLITLTYIDTKIFNDKLTNDEIMSTLEKGLPTTNISTNEDLENLKHFIDILQRTLIYYTLSGFFSGDNGQCIITKNIPTFNNLTQEYRIYPTAVSLIGIAYDYLLQNLTISKVSYTRVICEIPECNNEFAKTSKSNFCSAHADKEIRKYINHKYYEKHKKRVTEK